jgi:hypothetical protein
MIAAPLKPELASGLALKIRGRVNIYISERVPPVID